MQVMAVRRPPPTFLDRILDVVTDAAVLGFASWTIVYLLGRWAGVGTNAMLAVTVVLTVATTVVAWRAARPEDASPQEPPPADAGDAVHGVASTALLFWASMVAATAAVAIQGFAPRSWYGVGWALSVIALVPLVASLVRRSPREQPPGSRASDGAPAGAVPAASPRQLWASGFVVVTGIVLAYLSLLTFRRDADDVFYVNKAVFVAEHGIVPLRDTIYSDQVLPVLRGAGAAPAQSVEVLQGAVAHVFGLAGGTVAYLVTPPVVSFIAVCALWRLVRAWSPRRALVAFVVAIAYLMFGTKDGYGLGAFFIGRDWQGKVILVCVLVPLLYVAFTTWARRNRPYDAAMLFAVGTAAVGLSSTGTFLVPPIAAAVAVAMLTGRRPRWWVPLLALVFPVVSGLAVSATAEGSGKFGALAFTSEAAFHHVVGTGLWGALGLLAMLVAPWLVPSRAARLTAAAGSVAAVLVMAPGLPELLNRLTGAGPVLWRLTWVPALPALVGVLATAAAQDLPLVARARARLAPWSLAVPAAVLVAIVLGGQILWSRTTWLHHSPTWKFQEEFLSDARWIADHYHQPRPVLAPWEDMRALALTTTRIHAVDPRAFYLDGIDEPAAQHAARTRLSESMKNGDARPPENVGEDLSVLDVGLVCLDPAKDHWRAALDELSWRKDFAREGLTCYRPPA